MGKTWNAHRILLEGNICKMVTWNIEDMGWWRTEDYSAPVASQQRRSKEDCLHEPRKTSVPTCSGRRTASRVYPLSGRRGGLFSFTPRPPYPLRNNPRYTFDRRLGGPQSRSGRHEEEKNLLPMTVIEPRPTARCYIDWAILGSITVSRAVICCWLSPGKSFLISGQVGTHDHICSFRYQLCVLKWGLFFDERMGWSPWAGATFFTRTSAQFNPPSHCVRESLVGWDLTSWYPSWRLFWKCKFVAVTSDDTEMPTSVVQDSWNRGNPQLVTSLFLHFQ
jgi:hypothetical protein